MANNIATVFYELPLTNNFLEPSRDNISINDIISGKRNPIIDAYEAIQRKDFRFFGFEEPITSFEQRADTHFPAVRCLVYNAELFFIHRPNKERYGDILYRTDRLMLQKKHLRTLFNYGILYNHIVIKSLEFPAGDICRISSLSSGLLHYPFFEFNEKEPNLFRYLYENVYLNHTERFMAQLPEYSKTPKLGDDDTIINAIRRKDFNKVQKFIKNDEFDLSNEKLYGLIPIQWAVISGDLEIFKAVYYSDKSQNNVIFNNFYRLRLLDFALVGKNKEIIKILEIDGYK